MQTTDRIVLIYAKEAARDTKKILDLKSSKGRASRCEMQNVISG